MGDPIEPGGTAKSFAPPSIDRVLQFAALLSSVILISGYARANIIAATFGLSAQDYLSVSDYVNLGASASGLFFALGITFMLSTFVLPFVETKRGRSFFNTERHSLGIELLSGLVWSVIFALFGTAYVVLRVRFPEAGEGPQDSTALWEVPAILFGGSTVLHLLSIAGNYVAIQNTPCLIPIFVAAGVIVGSAGFSYRDAQILLAGEFNRPRDSYSFDNGEIVSGSQWQLILRLDRFLIFREPATGRIEARRADTLVSVSHVGG